MRARAVEAAVWGAALLASLTAIAGAVRGRPGPDLLPEAVPAAAVIPEVRSIDAHALAEAASTITGSNPFRLDRRPAQVAYGAEPPANGEQAPSAPPPARPTLELSGIIGGPPWEAIIEGVPGRDGGVLVRTGQLLGELRVRAVRPDTVIVEGPDTTWILTLRHPWQ